MKTLLFFLILFLPLAVVFAGDNTILKTNKVRYVEASPGTDYIEVRTPALGATFHLTWPADDGDASQCMCGDGNGAIDWSFITDSNISGQIGAAKGGTGVDSSSETGIPHVTAGTWVVGSAISKLADVDEDASDCATGEILKDVGASFQCAADAGGGDTSFRPLEATSTTLTIERGTKEWNGRLYCPYDGGGTLESDIADLTVSTGALGDDVYSIYVDTEATTFVATTDLERQCYMVESTEIHFDTDHDLQGSQYFKIGKVVISGGGGNISSVGDERPREGVSWANMELYNLTDWVSYTPTGSWASDPGNATYTGKWKRIGDDMLIRAKVATSWAPTATNILIDLPPGYTIDGSKLADDVREDYGLCQIREDGIATYHGKASHSGSDNFDVAYYNTSGAVAEYLNVGHDAPFTWGANDYLVCDVRVPIVGWTTHTGAITSTLHRYDSPEITTPEATGVCSALSGYSAHDTSGPDLTMQGMTIQIDHYEDDGIGTDLELWSYNVGREHYIFDSDTVCIKWLAGDFTGSSKARFSAGQGPKVGALPLGSMTELSISEASNLAANNHDDIASADFVAENGYLYTVIAGSSINGDADTRINVGFRIRDSATPNASAGTLEQWNAYMTGPGTDIPQMGGFVRWDKVGDGSTVQLKITITSTANSQTTVDSGSSYARIIKMPLF